VKLSWFIVGGILGGAAYLVAGVTGMLVLIWVAALLSAVRMWLRWDTETF